MKKLVSMLLALCMMCTLAVPALAEPVELAPAPVAAAEEAPAVTGGEDTAKQAAPAEVPAAPVDGEEPVEKYDGAAHGAVEGRKGAAYRGGALQFGFGSGLNKLYMQQGTAIWLPVVEPSVNRDECVDAYVTGAWYTERTPGVVLTYDDTGAQGVWLHSYDNGGNLSGTGTCIIYLEFQGGGQAALNVEIVPSGAAMPGVNVAQGTFRVPANGIFAAGSMMNCPSDPNLSLLAWIEGDWNINMGTLSNGQTGFQVESTNGCPTTLFGFAFASEVLRTAWAGAVTLQAPPNVSQITAFCTRLYEKCLGRAPDSGIQTWINVLSDNSWTAERVAWGFIFSPEYTNRHTSNSEYVKMLYRVYMDREYDQSGYNTWMNCLANGWSREQVMNGFSRSKEFRDICARYGMTPW